MEGVTSNRTECPIGCFSDRRKENDPTWEAEEAESKQ